MPGRSINACCKNEEAKQNARQIVDALKTPVTLPDETVGNALLKAPQPSSRASHTGTGPAEVEDALKLYLAEQQ